MQWWHPLVWEKIMVGLCLCWDRGGWWGKRLCIMVFWTMLLRMPLQPRGNIPIAANITFLEDSLGHYNKTSNISISRFLIKMCLDYNFCHLVVQELHNLWSTTHWSAKKLCNGKGGVPRLKCLKNGLRNFWIIPYFHSTPTLDGWL